MMAVILQTCFKKQPNLKQVDLLPEIVCAAFLVADSSKHAYYHIRIELDAGIYIVCKESGIKGRVLDKRAWPQKSLDRGPIFVRTAHQD